MKEREWSARVVLRYTLLQLPALGILIVALIFARRWFDVPFWFSAGLIVFWVVKDAVMFPYVWKAYDPDGACKTHPMIGARGVAEERLDPEGYIRVGHELWRAELVDDEGPVEKGEDVRVRGMRGITLIVERPAAGSASQSSGP